MIKRIYNNLIGEYYMEPIEQVNDDFNAKKPKKTKLIIGVAICLLIIIAVVVSYFCIFNKPQYVFDRTIDKLFTEKTEEVNSLKFNSDLKISVDTDDEDIKSSFDELRKCNLKMGLQMDMTTKKEIFDLGLEYDKQAVVDARWYYNNGEVYAYLDKIFDKYIEIELSEEEKKNIADIFETAVTSKKQNETVNKILKEEIKTQIKKEGNFKKESDQITIGEKSKKVTKYTLELSQKNLRNIISNLCVNLAKNEEFLKCFKDENLKENLNTLAEEIQSELPSSNEGILKISLYTKGILNKLVGVDVGIEVPEENIAVKLLVVKEKEKNYSYKLNVKSNGANIQVANGKVEFDIQKNKNSENGKITINVEISKIIANLKANLELNYSVEIGNEIDEINVANSVKIEDLTDEDILIITKALEERPLIGEIISNLNELQSNSEDDFIDEIDLEEDYDWLEEDF